MSQSDISSFPEVLHRLQERVKELNCLYGITRLVENGALAVDQILKGVAELIPPSWQYPDVTCARIKLRDRCFQTENFQETGWKQSEDIQVNGLRLGSIEVFYLEEMPKSDEGPFLAEERNLIHVISERLGHIIEHRMVEESLHSLYQEEKRLREQVQDEMQRRIVFTRNLIHELKTPLTSLLATSQLLYEEEQNGKLGKLAEYVWEGANSLNNRIDELHDVVKGEIGTLKLDIKPVDISVLLSALVNETRALAGQNDMELRLKIKNDIPVIEADAGRVRQVVLNLLNNAFKYAAGGGLVEIICSSNDRSVQVEVKDRGKGLTPFEQEHLFESGYQVSFNGGGRGGLGIGLALCKLLVDLHGGHIRVRSTVGKGSSFIFTLPINAFEKSVARSSAR